MQWRPAPPASSGEHGCGFRTYLRVGCTGAQGAGARGRARTALCQQLQDAHSTAMAWSYKRLPGVLGLAADPMPASALIQFIHKVAIQIRLESADQHFGFHIRVI